MLANASRAASGLLASTSGASLELARGASAVLARSYHKNVRAAPGRGAGHRRDGRAPQLCSPAQAHPPPVQHAQA